MDANLKKNNLLEGADSKTWLVRMFLILHQMRINNEIKIRAPLCPAPKGRG